MRTPIIGIYLFGALAISAAWLLPSNAQVGPSFGSAAPYQWQPAGAMQSQLAVSTTAVTSLTVPATATAANVCLRTGAVAVNYSDDGSTTPVTGAAGAGMQLAPASCQWLQGASLLSNFKAIASTAASAIDVSYFK